MASKAGELHIIVTCTERKSVLVPGKLRLRNIIVDDAPATGRSLASGESA